MSLSSADAARLGRLADPVKVHRELAADSRESLLSAIYDAHQAGATERDLARACGWSRSHVHRLLIREAERRQLLVLDQPPADTAGQ